MLDDLTVLLERLRTRIEQHGALLRPNEALTRYALIDPLLRVLGWDTEDPGVVRAEYQSGGGRADYALFSGNSPICFVEAKSLDSSLQGAATQGITYCMQQGTKYFVLTDGRRWELYEAHKAVPMDQKKVAEFDIGGPVHEATLKALYLWRPNLAGPQLVAPPSPLVVPVESAAQPGRPAPAAGTGSAFAARRPPTELEPTAGAETLADFRPSLNQPVPSRLRMPDGTERQLRYWNELFVEVVRWLVDKGKLTAVHCPIQRPGSSRYLVHTSRQHPDGRDFRSAHQVGNLWVDTSYNVRDLAENSRFVLTKVGEDPHSFSVS